MTEKQMNAIYRSRNREVQSFAEKLKLIYNREIFTLRLLIDTIDEQGEPDLIDLKFSVPFPEIKENLEAVPDLLFKSFINELFLEYQNLHFSLAEKIAGK